MSKNSFSLSRVWKSAVLAALVTAAPMGATAAEQGEVAKVDVNTTTQPQVSLHQEMEIRAERDKKTWEKARARSEDQKKLDPSDVRIGPRIFEPDIKAQYTKPAPGHPNGIDRVGAEVVDQFNKGEVEFHLVYVIPPMPGTNDNPRPKAEAAWRGIVANAIDELKELAQDVMTEGQQYGAIIDKIWLVTANRRFPGAVRPGTIYFQVGDRLPQTLVSQRPKRGEALPEESETLKEMLLSEFKVGGHLIPHSEYGKGQSAGVSSSKNDTSGGTDGEDSGKQGAAEDQHLVILPG